MSASFQEAQMDMNGVLSWWLFKKERYALMQHSPEEYEKHADEYLEGKFVICMRELRWLAGRHPAYVPFVEELAALIIDDYLSM